MKALLSALLLCSSLLFADTPVAEVIAPENNVTAEDINETQISLMLERQKVVHQYEMQLTRVEAKLSSENLWTKSHSSYLTYLDSKKELETIKKRIVFLSKHGDSIDSSNELSALESKESILDAQLTLLSGKDQTPFSSLLNPKDIGETPEITNPLDLFTGVSFKKLLRENFETYRDRERSLVQTINFLRQRTKILKDLAQLDESKYTSIYNLSNIKLDRFEAALDTVKSTAVVYGQHVEEVELKVEEQMKVQSYKLLNIGIIVTVVFVLFFLMNLGIKRYITDNERFYMANKFLTFAKFVLIVLIVVFNYMEDVSYFITILGFASAGIAIAMKDWFMSVLGWLVIIFGGSIHVGDRIRVDMDGIKYVGDVMDISLLRITLLEDITLTTVYENRRAGRILFIPNNYIFTRMIANYSHDSLKTVWDGIDINITFDSNHKKAVHIAKEVARKYSKGYTDITRKQLNKLRNKYSLKNTNVEPRIFSLPEDYGIKISTWYLTNAYATLTLRSVIYVEIIDEFNKADDIQIAYQTQQLNLSRGNSIKASVPSSDMELV